MIFGQKSDLKKHLSTKKPTWAHKIVAKPAHDQASETDIKMQSVPGKDPPLKPEGSETALHRY